MKRLVLFILVIVSLLLSACSTQTTAPAPTPTSSIDTSQETQAKRYAYMQELIDKGYIQKIEKPGSLPYVWVTPLFYTLDFDAKEIFISVIWTYYIVQDSKASTVRIFDSKTGK